MPMDERRLEDGEVTDTIVVVRRRRLTTLAKYLAVGVLIALLVVVAGVWIERRPIATHYLKREFERRGVAASYHLDRVGLRTQEVHDLVIGDPAHPDLIARHAIIQMRLKWDGSFEVYRIYARGVRLRGTLKHGKVSWGQIDKLLPPPSNKPFALPNFAIDVADSSIALATPFGPLGAAVQGSGTLSGGFKGLVTLASPRITPGRCGAERLHASLAVAVVARRPHVEGPVSVGRFACPASRLGIEQPRFDINASFNESFTRIDGSGRMAIQTMNAGPNGLAAFIGDLTFKGDLTNVAGRVKLSAQRSRLGTIYADRTRLNGRYRLNSSAGSFALVGKFAADSTALAPSMLASVTGPLAAASKTPIGPIARRIGEALTRTARNFNTAGDIRVVNFPGGGAARITNAEVIGANGARASVNGGTGVTYYWPAGALRIDSNIAMGGGGLPSGRINLSQPRPGAPMSGVGEFAPYSVNGTRLALAPIRFGPGPGGSTAISTAAQLDGPFPDGRVQGLRLPITARLGPGSAFAFGTACAVVSFDYLKSGALQLGRTRLPVCPIGSAIVSKRPGGSVVAGARFSGPVLNGRLGKSALSLRASGGQILGKDFAVNNLAMRLGKPAAPIIFNAARLTGTFTGPGVGGRFSGADATIGNVPLRLSDGSGRWLMRHGDLSADSALTVSDRDPNPRFYPLRGNDVHLTLGGDYVRARGSLQHPATGTRITDIAIEHQLSTGAGHADLDVPGIAFGSGLQPEQLTRLTEGVVALVNGTVRGHGRINWNGTGAVTSTGDFSTANMDLAAPFGPVTGLTTTLHFTDLLKLETAPHQVASIASINPGIEVTNGTIRYQILPNNLVKIERGEWPFMGGTLILQETVLNFGRPTAKRLTFQLVGFNAKMFVDTLGFEGIELTGTFDGVLPMIFDENGGRIVGGRLDSRPPGGVLIYHGTKPQGLAPGIVFDLFSNIRYKSMIVRLNGDLAGEFATTMTIEGPSLGPSKGLVAGLVHKVFSQIPIRLNVNISGPFRALIQTAKAFKDPTQAIAPVLPFPIDSPALDVQVLSTRKSEEQTTEPAPKTRTTPMLPPSGGSK